MASSKSPPSPLGNSNSTSSARTTAAAANNEPNIQVEFALNVNMPEELNKVDRLLRNNGYRLLSTDFEDKTIKLELESMADGRMRSVQRLQEFIEKETGFLAVIKGVGELASAVSELRPSNISIRTGINVHGVIRLSQLDNNFCYADVSLGYNHHKLERPVLLSLAIHEYGNLEGDEYAHIGEPIVDIDKLETSDTDVTLSKAIGNCNVAEMIGRSIAVTRLSRESKDKTVISAGVVARAATVQQNKKQVCSCSGKTLWEERIDRKKAEQGGQ